MKAKLSFSKNKNYIINLLFPAIVFGFATGVLTSLVIAIYKLCAKHIIAISEAGYEFLRGHLYLIPIVLGIFLLIAFALSKIYKKVPNIMGGGIPTSVGILRGIITFKWLRNLFGVFFLSLVSFLIGVPLGNEGPSVQMGTAIGRGSVYTFAKNHKAWDRYSMTGGACAGLSVATGAPISGILFAIEEAHQRISPTIMIVASSSVMFGSVASSVFSKTFGVNIRMLDEILLPRLEISHMWIPVLVGILTGLFGVIFLRYYELIDTVIQKKLHKIPMQYKIFAILTLTMVFGLISFSFVSTGHELIEGLLIGEGTIVFLLLVILIRSTLTLSANSSGITGGTFIPILSIGAAFASIIGKACLYFGLDEKYYTVIVIFGITACISGLMKMPLTSIAFSIEALSCYENIVPVIIASFFSYLVTEIFKTKSISDSVIENRVEALNEVKVSRVIDTYVVVQAGAFAIGKQIRDIFWPKDLFVLSVKHDTSRNATVDQHGGNELREGDMLHVRYSTADPELSRQELLAIVGYQEYDQSTVKNV